MTPNTGQQLSHQGFHICIVLLFKYLNSQAAFPPRGTQQHVPAVPSTRIPAALTFWSFAQQGAGQDQDTQQHFQERHPGASWGKRSFLPDTASSRKNFPFCCCGSWILSLFYSILLYKELLINFKLIRLPDNLPSIFSFMKPHSSIKISH